MKRCVATFIIAALAVLASGCIFNVTSYRDADGNIVYVGEVKNDGAPLSSPEVVGTFYDAAGGVIATERTNACRVMSTGSVAAFKLVLPAGTAQPARAEWKLEGEVVDNAYLADGLTAEITGTAPATPGTDVPIVVGEVQNNSANTYTGGYVCLAWVNPRGEVLRVAEGSGSGIRFAPGARMPFYLREEAPAGATDVLFFLDAGVTPPGEQPPPVVDLPETAYRNEFQSSGLNPLGSGNLFLSLGEIHNNGSQTIDPILTAVTRDAQGRLTGVADSRGLCLVPAFPGSFTYGGYILTNNASASQQPQLSLEASQPPDQDTFRKLTPTSVKSSTGSGGLVRVTGRVRNTTDVTLLLVGVCAGTYDADGTVIGAAMGFAEVGFGGLEPGETAEFEIEVPAFGDVDDVKAIAAGLSDFPFGEAP